MTKIAKLLFPLLLIAPSICFSCKEAAFSKKYPINDFTPYSNIVIAQINESEHNDKLRYKPLVSFKATVIGNFKGTLEIGDSFSSVAVEEVAHAVCPIHLKNGGVYLLLLKNIDGKTSISRFSFPVSSENPYFSTYIQQIKSLIINE